MLGSVDGGDAGDGDEDRGGDPVCWMDRVCPECGHFATGRLPAACEQCGAAVPGS